ncbi:MurR/RpiR family transcriptional regulator [Arthrobacter bambusae]|uniref:MurR/RpiR family transcriptional regulator n=1 Tax=Arthrobacter bambusae TaxID=1338426 RepID=UPI001F50DB54|nr:MurR/RpiR family transcriptional regulator [Arthrobacter bambusae]MCI0142984.1 MurR/RpiR family transcriptional regulator [Arthrobacter bambusae]
MRLSDALQSKAGSLTEADRRIGNTLLTSSFGVAGLTAAQIAVEAKVHESSVVRFAQKLGYDGFPSLRAELIADFERQVDRAGIRSARTKANRDPSLAAIVAAQIELLSDLPRIIEQSSIESAAEILWAARQVLVLGRGLMSAPAVFMTRKLGLLGVPAIHSDQGGGEAVERAALLREGDAVLIFAFNEEYAFLAPLIVALKARGVRGILVTDQASLFEDSLPEVVLPVPRRHNDHGVMAAISIVGYAIQFAMADQRPEQARKVSSEIVKLAASSRFSHATRDYDHIPNFGQEYPAEPQQNGASR